MLLLEQQLVWDQGKPRIPEWRNSSLCAKLEGLDALIQQNWEGPAPFLSLGSVGTTGNQRAWTGANLAAGGVIDFPGIPAQNASNQSCANAGNSQTLLWQRGQEWLHVKPHAGAERDRFSTTSPTKSLLTFVPWAKQSRALSVQGCLQSTDADFAGCCLLPSL